MDGPGPTRRRFRHLTSVHDVDDSRILHRECASLARAGHDVAVIAGRPANGPVDGVRIVGVGASRNRVDRMTRVAWRVLRAARRERADVCHLHDPELLWVGLLLKLGGHRVVYDVHEDVPKQIMSKFWLPRWARRPIALVAALVERFCAAVFDAVVAATPSIAERFPAAKTTVVQNFPQLTFAESDDAAAPAEDRPYAFVYTGGLSAVQGVRELVATAALLPTGSKAVLAGPFVEDDAFEEEIRSSPRWAAVDYLGMVSRDEVVAAIGSARCGVILNHPVRNYLESYSTKMFEYMACGVPVVCSNFPLWARIVGDADCGVVVDPLDPPAVAAAIEKLAANPEEAARLGENGRRAVRERYNWEAEFTKLDELYRRLARQ